MNKRTLPLAPPAMGPKMRLPEGETVESFKARWDAAVASDQRGKPLKVTDNPPVIDFHVETANIVAMRHDKEILPGRFITRHSYTWEGEAGKPVWITKDVIDSGAIYEFPWPLTVIGIDPSRDLYLCVRTWGLNIGDCWHHRSRIAQRIFAREFRCRLIYILMILGLAYVPRYDAPNWSHIGKKAPR